MYEKSLLLFVGTLGSLFIIMNPVSTAVVFLGLASNDPPKERLKIAFRASMFAFFTLMIFFVGGRLIMEFFGISVPGLRIAGGIVVAKVGLGMLSMENPDDPSEELQMQAKKKGNIAFIPLAMPMLSGPGSIATTIGLTSDITSKLDYLAVIAGITAVCIISFLILASATKVHKLIGQSGVEVISKVMGLIVLCIGVQFIGRGFIDMILHQDLVDALRNAYINGVGAKY